MTNWRIIFIDKEMVVCSLLAHIYIALIDKILESTIILNLKFEENYCFRVIINKSLQSRIQLLIYIIDIVHNIIQLFELSAR